MPQDNSLSKTTLILETGENLDFLVAKLNQAIKNGEPLPGKTVVACRPGQKEKILGKLSAPLKKLKVVEIRSFPQDFPPLVTTPFLAYLPRNAPFCPLPLDGLDGWKKDTLFLRPWIPPVTLGENEWARLVYMDFGWISTPVIFQHLGSEGSLTLLDLEKITRKKHLKIHYLSTPASAPSMPHGKLPESSTKLSPESRILALVPHFKCEEWLEQCLDSLVNQTRPPDAIMVLDDRSPNPPVDIVRKFKNVTLLRSPENVGPYRLIQSVIDQTQFDAYLFQDADDWSSLDRLETLLEEAKRSGAEWIGTQELMYFEDSIHAARYPLDLNSTPQASIHNPFCFPSSLISREFLMRLGGFASGFRFSGDFELLTRAVWAGKVANLDRYAYFRRIRKNSLITSGETGLASAARQEVDSQIEKRKAENLARVIKGGAPLLEPLKTAEPLVFEHLAGPALK